MNPYLRSLEDELAQLRARRVNLRRTIDFYAKGQTFSGDALDARRAQQRAAMELRSSEFRYAELHHLLGRALPGKPVKLLRARR